MKRLIAAINPFAARGSDETGEMNARRFVRVVTRIASDERIIQMVPHEGFRGVKRETHGWVWMLNPKWRERVLELLREAPVKDAQFHAPDSMDGWTFSATSTVPVPRIATLSLEETL